MNQHLTFAYADPPYLGCCGLYGHEHGDDGRCWDLISTHEHLIESLSRDYPDGWALSCTSGSLRHLLPLTPAEARVAAWVKPFCAFKRGVRPCYAWEPLIYWGGRNPGFGYPHEPPAKGGEQVTPKDYVSTSITLRKGLTGAKPPVFCRWVLELLGYRHGDVVVDIFPGTGVMGRIVADHVVATQLPWGDETEGDDP